MSTTNCKWSELPPELLTSIGKRLETRIDVLRFRSVCSSWRSSLPFGTWPPPLPLTLPFPIVPHSFPHPRAHYTLTVATVYRLHNPSTSPPNTWIIKVSENLPQGRMRLLNPLSIDKITPLPQNYQKILDLSQFRISEICPSFSLGVTYEDFDNRDYFNRISGPQENQEMINAVQKAVFFDNLTVVVIHNNGDLAGLRHGDERWRPLVGDGGKKAYSDLINFKGKIYAVSDKGDCLVIDSSLDVREFSSPWNYLSGNKLYLVESCGELCLLVGIDRRAQFYNVQNIHMHSPHRFCFKACKLKEVEHEWVEVSDLGDRILFASRDCCSFSVSAADFKACNKGDFIFFLNDFYSDASVALWDPDYYDIYDVGLDDKVPQIYRVGDRCVDQLEAHPGFAFLFQPLSSLLASGSSSSSRSRPGSWHKPKKPPLRAPPKMLKK